MLSVCNCIVLVLNWIVSFSYRYPVYLFRHLMLVENDFLGHWNDEWNYLYTDLREPPLFVAKEKAIKIVLKVCKNCLIFS